MNWAFWVGSVGGVGFAPVASGTWGSAAAAALAPFVFMPLPMGWRIFVLLVLFVLGGVAGTKVERALGKKDPGIVVIDELVGQWITYMFFFQLDWAWLFWGFFLFRVFDVWKPYPIRASENWLPEGFGIMIDDVLAGLYAAVCLGIMHWVLA